MRIDIFTIFPEPVQDMARLSVLGRARETGLIDVRVHDLRMASTDPHRTVDDKPFGGGAGMVLKPEPAFAAVEAVEPPRPLFLLDPGGRRFDQQTARELAALDGFSLICGRYEGVDERIRTNLVDAEMSVGDVVLAGGEFAAMVVVEAVARLVPGVLGNEASVKDETFVDDLLEYPQWTRPAVFRELEAPEILRSGDHALIDRWRRAMAIARTAELRPDLLERRGITQEELLLLDEFHISVDHRFVSE
ncbi:MAG: tRNA (guanosine(37)-N1)-methyltransferase TrmD [Actinomycetota bacterium]|uniref:tRNA (guanine-N(1)-)-methyltransferase n=1 Tax=marine metagenome TaxID=408172 RepID=A0A381QJE3_9ZZZZ|nr:tRNA (guanosine(37)-N1)-methyltransferase TrmD [Acidimicrobiales bacterium]MEC8921743.1 tRNA (guanosine(37)-N1)-methyltransferase TrmD [Actinomycetota bacterium]MED5552985.1 tRNA (guanosine(37)-N1)-methyltransferase TrmD [Actinomycetota bacterium]MEE2680517.1 tRNA (guanosine(37)-N1)-methyltransferase TrmD [Actinomycetota bacterium]MEE3187998.1 tRNA (guanosine(37)-N1)-methyltransferase TrmD [Actinomycetota bacterium]|tara:strand:+ start:126 stop:869 length:744 start_codon:yes stop_codon:yes gene_type:complete